MAIDDASRRTLGTMIAYGFPGLDAAHDLAIARRIGAAVVEVLPDWRSYPDPARLRDEVADAGLAVHSVHGSWGGQSVVAPRVDLASLDDRIHRNSVDDLRRCVDWIVQVGGRCLVVHPGGLSDPEDFNPRGETLRRGLEALADHAKGTGVSLCVENMPPGVHPGSHMGDLRSFVEEIARPEVALALDTGHAQITSSPAMETRAAGALLRTTHVHDNDGRQDSHLPPGLGVVDWRAWAESLDDVGYTGPIMLECIRHLRRHPEVITDEFLERLRSLL